MGALHVLPGQQRVYRWVPMSQFATHLPPGPIDPGQQAIGLSPLHVRPVDHSVEVGPPEHLSAGNLPTPPPITEVALVTPLFTVARIANGVAIFGTGGGRPVTP